MNQNKQKYRTGQYVKGKVERLLPYGLFVQLNDGTRAYIRRRELTWSGNIDPRELWQAGDKIEGQVLKLAEPGQLLELSHRATLPDPWDAFVNRHRQGDVVEGSVKNLTSYGVYIEVEPGVDGLIPLCELTTWQVEQPEEVVWVGDVVEAVIIYLDYHSRKLKLSVRARLEQLKTVAGVIEQCNLFSPPALATVELNETKARDQISAEVQFDLRAKPDLDPLALERVGRILVIEDYEAIRLSLVEWLQNLGYEVDEARDVAEAFQKIRATSYGLLLVDLNLPGIDGLAFIRGIRSEGINCHVALMSAAEWLDKRQHDIEAVGAVEVLVKPLDRTEIEHLLAEIGTGALLPTWPKRPKSNQAKAPESFDQLAEVISTKGSLTVQLQAGLEQLVATTPAETGLIFYLDPYSQEVSILAQAGQVNLKAEAIHGLCASPVRDVIRDGDQILENQMLGIVRERFRKLLDLFPFEACIGLPLPANGEVNHALFLFHHRPDVFNRYRLRDALAASSLFATAIERQTMEERFRSLNKLLLSGQLASGFGHEVYNKISGLEFQLRNLQTDFRKFETQIDGTNSTFGLAEIKPDRQWANSWKHSVI